MTELLHFRLDAVPSSWPEILSSGRRVTALAHDPEDYYHTRASLVFDDGSVLKAVAHEHCLAHLFDCYTLAMEKSTELPRNRIPLSPVFEIGKALALIQDEWIVPAGELDGQTIGNNPHIHASGPPGSASEGAIVFATCLAGVLLVAGDGRQIAILAADDVPLNVDVVSDAGEVEDLVNRHECRLLGAGAGITEYLS